MPTSRRHKRHRYTAPPIILNVCNSWRLICTHETRRYPMNMRLDGHYELSGWSWNRETFLPITGFKPWSVQPEASCWLQCPSLYHHKNLTNKISEIFSPLTPEKPKFWPSWAEIVLKYQKLWKFYYMKWNFL
jgi:hypothetical protein